MTTTDEIDPVLLVPYPDELEPRDDYDIVTTEELGWRMLPAGATPAQRARAESVWRPVDAGRPCRCSGPCDHGKVCGDCGDGRIVHADRYGSSMLSVTGWQDDYQCDACGVMYSVDGDLPSLPWGEVTRVPWGEAGEMSTSVSKFPGVRHHGFAYAAEDVDVYDTEVDVVVWPTVDDQDDLDG